jgi:trehalose 6-phosphate phosphatase
MQHLFENWEGIQDRIQKAHFFPLLLDYDGTLTPIVSRPELALCPPEVKALLEKLRDLPNVHLAIISGRALEDICRIIGIPQITYVGNHGLSIRNPAGIHKKKLSPKRQKEFEKISQELRKSLGQIPGILFEDKGSTLAVHYRNSRKEDITRIRESLSERLQEWHGSWETTQGKMVIEVRPKIDIHKGKAVIEILKIFPSTGALPFYLGDDQTDEDAFRTIKGVGITVYVGPAETISQAEYYLRTPREVVAFLQRCEEIFRLKSKAGEGRSHIGSSL